MSPAAGWLTFTNGRPEPGSTLRTSGPPYLAFSPLDGTEDGANYVTHVAVLVDVMAEVRRVPDDHVLAADVFPVDEAVDGDRSVRLWVASLARGCGDAVVDLAWVEPQDPHIPAREGVRDVVVRAGDQVVGVAGLGVPDLPPPAEVGPLAAPGFELERVPVVWGEDGRGVELAHLVVRAADVEVEPPVDVMVVDVADARGLHGVEPEARADGPVVVKSPTTHITVPTRLQLADQDGFPPLAVYRGAPEVPLIRPGLDNSLRGRLGPAYPRGDVRPVRLDKALLEEPVAERTAGVPVVLNVEDRGVGLEEHELAAVHHVSQLDTGGVRPLRSRRPDHEEAPERAPVGSGGVHLELAGEAPGGDRLILVGRAAGLGGRQRQRRSPLLEPRHRP